jgi:hypothetical protein
MGYISMDQPAGKKTVPLVLPGYSRWIEDQVINYFLIAEGCKRNDGGYDDNDEGDGKLVHYLKIRIIKL